jgi:hypothetical protein
LAGRRARRWRNRGTVCREHRHRAPPSTVLVPVASTEGKRVTMSSSWQ